MHSMVQVSAVQYVTNLSNTRIPTPLTAIISIIYLRKTTLSLPPTEGELTFEHVDFDSAGQAPGSSTPFHNHADVTNLQMQHPQHPATHVLAS